MSDIDKTADENFVHDYNEEYTITKLKAELETANKRISELEHQKAKRNIVIGDALKLGRFVKAYDYQNSTGYELAVEATNFLLRVENEKLGADR